MSWLSDARARAEKATPGPWEWVDGPTMPVLRGAELADVCDFGDSEQYYPREGTPPDDVDREFIATVRSDAPKAYALLEEAAAEFEYMLGLEARRMYERDFEATKPTPCPCPGCARMRAWLKKLEGA